MRKRQKEQIQLKRTHCLATEVLLSVPGNIYFCSSVLMKTSKQKLALNSQVK